MNEICNAKNLRQIKSFILKKKMLNLCYIFRKIRLNIFREFIYLNLIFSGWTLFFLEKNSSVRFFDVFFSFFFALEHVSLIWGFSCQTTKSLVRCFYLLFVFCVCVFLWTSSICFYFCAKINFVVKVYWFGKFRWFEICYLQMDSSWYRLKDTKFSIKN